MSDPRVLRTRKHIQATVRELISNGEDDISISSIAAAGRVSRRTIYVHWGTIEELVADSVFEPNETLERAEFLSTYKNPLRLLPAMVREVVEQRGQRDKRAAS